MRSVEDIKFSEVYCNVQYSMIAKKCFVGKKMLHIDPSILFHHLFILVYRSSGIHLYLACE